MSAADDEIRAAYEGLVVDTVIEELDRLRAENERSQARLSWCEELLEQTSTGERVLADAVADADEEIASLKAENARLHDEIARLNKLLDADAHAEHLADRKFDSLAHDHAKAVAERDEARAENTRLRNCPHHGPPTGEITPCCVNAIERGGAS